MLRIYSNKQGFTLIELMIVVAIVGILSAIVYPSYEQYVIRSKRADAMAALNIAAQAIERYRANNYSYETGDDIKQFFADQVPVEGGTAYYTLSIVDSVTTYTLTAKPTGNMAGRDGALTLTNAGERSWTDKDDVSHPCWPEGGNSC